MAVRAKSAPSVPVIRTITAMREWSRRERRRGKSIAFVPTMGALHAGHTALLRAAQRSCDRVVASIFVNPAQFGPKEDLAAYPRTLEADLAASAKAGADVAFVPSVSVMYPEKAQTLVSVPALQRSLCALGRPGHFEGVCLVVAKLLHIVEPDRLFLGQKDAQQARILTRMIEDLDFPVRVVVVPTVREPDGLALSSRNQYLAADERAYAPRLHEALERGRARLLDGERATGVLDAVRAHLLAPPVPKDRLSIEYVELVDAETLEPADGGGSGELLLALAVRLGRARLIDNVRVRLGAVRKASAKRTKVKERVS